MYLDYPGYENYGKERKQEISDSSESQEVMRGAGVQPAGRGAGLPLLFSVLPRAAYSDYALPAPLEPPASGSLDVAIKRVFLDACCIKRGRS